MVRGPSPPGRQPVLDRTRVRPSRTGAGVSGIAPTLLARLGLRLMGEPMDPELWAERPVVLLAEDEAIIAIDLEESLDAAGFAVAGPFATNAEAKAWLKTGRPDIAILDHALKDGLCDALARDLARQGVPAIIFTGHEAGPERSGDLATARWVTKPIAFPALLATIRNALRAGPGAAPGS